MKVILTEELAIAVVKQMFLDPRRAVTEPQEAAATCKGAVYREETVYEPARLTNP